MKKGLNYTIVGILAMIFGVTLFEDIMWLKYVCLASAIVLTFIGVVLELKKENRKKTVHNY